MLLCIITSAYLCCWAGILFKLLSLIKLESPQLGFPGGDCAGAAEGIRKHIHFMGQSCVICCSAC